MSTELKAAVLRQIALQGGAEEALRLILQDGPSKYECELWDYKESYTDDAFALAELCRDVVSFHNAYGGYIILGIADDFEIKGFANSIDQQTLRQKIRHYFGADIAVSVEELPLLDHKRLTVVGVPKRLGPTLVATRPGPNPQGGKPVFNQGAVFFRVDDSCQLIRGSEDLQFLASSRVHSLEGLGPERGVTQSNLPDRNAICPNLIGRSDVKAELWLWLADRLSRYRVVAGPGGFGKTSAAYYFAEDVTETSSNGFYQVLWLSAKKKQFSGAAGGYEDLPYSVNAGDSFHDIESMLSTLAASLAISAEEWSDASMPDRIGLLREALETIPSFVVLDDLDSLTPDEQRQVVQLVMQIAGGASKFLLTTRNNLVAPNDSTTRMPGLKGEDFRGFVELLSQRFGRGITTKELGELEEATQGSPLFAESVFRLMKLGSKFGEALKLWRGKDGEAVRAACFKREVKNLTFKARRSIFALSRVESASLPELCRFAELERVEVEQAILELDQLFLCSSEEIAGEPRFRVPENLRRLLEEEKGELVPEHAEIERRVAALQKEATGGGKSRGKNAPIAAAINQAMAQLGNGDLRGACETVDVALKLWPGSADLWMVKARCFAAVEPVDVELVRRAFEKSYSLGKREQRLFEKWIDFEITEGNTNAAIDVGQKGDEAFEQPNFMWLGRIGHAYFKRGDQRLRRGELEDASQDFRASLQHLNKALSAAPKPARSSIGSAMERSGEGLWSAMPVQRGVVACIQILRTARDALQAGDRRSIWGERCTVALGTLARGSSTKVSSSEMETMRSQVDWLSRHLMPSAYDRLLSLLDLVQARS